MQGLALVITDALGRVSRLGRDALATDTMHGRNHGTGRFKRYRQGLAGVITDALGRVSQSARDAITIGTDTMHGLARMHWHGRFKRQGLQGCTAGFTDTLATDTRAGGRNHSAGQVSRLARMQSARQNE